MLALVIVAIVAWFVTGPLRRSRSQTEAADAGSRTPRSPSSRRERRPSTARSATRSSTAQQGKLSEADWRRQDAELRREAIEILKQLDRLRGRRDAAERPSAFRYTAVAMETVLGVVQVIISVILIFLVLLHSGKDAGLSGAFGIGQSGSSFGGGSLVERNLDRWTVFFAILFVVNTLVLLKI